MTTIDREQLRRVFAVTDARTLEGAALASHREFVRGRSQLSALEAGQQPNGHVITAFEALRSYGIDVLDEAIEYGSAILMKHPNAVGQALRRQRDALGLDYAVVSRRTGVLPTDIERIEADNANDLPMDVVESIAFVLGMDEALLSFDGIQYNAGIVSTPGRHIGTIDPNAMIVFSEAASVIRTQHRLQRWLGVTGFARNIFTYEDNISVDKAWALKYVFKTTMDALLHHNEIGAETRLLQATRFAEQGLGIPVVQAELPQRIASATIAVSDGSLAHRGVVLNITGKNEDTMIRTATLIHEVKRILVDRPGAKYNVHIVQRVSDSETISDFVGFILALIGRMCDDGTVEMITSSIVEMFGWLSSEDYAHDYSPIPNLTILRRGWFSGLVVDAWKQNYISSSTAASYLSCSVDILRDHADTIQRIHQVERAS